ncbi:MAG: hypothetical protein HXX20_13070 [Chloroflexi bacterium]|nr:hypothetical protein [Chloroflexota bacterium]NWJ96709.1 hypothetical protein [Chloroflexota bacterium]
MWTARAVVVAPTDEDTTYSSGKSLTSADATAELIAILATVVGKAVKKVTVSQELDATALASYVLALATHQYEDADLVLTRVDATLGLVTKTRYVENMDLAHKLTGRPEINIADATIIAIATTYHDGSGIGGYSIDAASKFRV